MKKCIGCGEEKPNSKFKKKKLKTNKRFNECVDCSYKRYMNRIILEYGLEYWDKCVIDDLKLRISSRHYQAFKSRGVKKEYEDKKLIGCDWKTLKKHLESFFDDDINWYNFNQWHIDHVIPLCSAKTTDELLPLLHYKNLQPLMAFDNIKKGGSMPKQSNNKVNPKHYDNEHGSLYKMALERGWNAYQFDAIKRIDRANKKGEFKTDIEKSKRVLDMWLNKE